MIHLHSSTRPTRLYYVPTEAPLDPEPEGVLSVVGAAGAPLDPWRELGMAQHVSAHLDPKVHLVMHVVGKLADLAQVRVLRSFPFLAAQALDGHLLAHFSAVTTLQHAELDFGMGPDGDEFDGRLVLLLHGDGGRRMEAGGG